MYSQGINSSQATQIEESVKLVVGLLTSCEETARNFHLILGTKLLSVFVQVLASLLTHIPESLIANFKSPHTQRIHILVTSSLFQIASTNQVSFKGILAKLPDAFKTLLERAFKHYMASQTQKQATLAADIERAAPKIQLKAFT